MGEPWKHLRPVICRKQGPRKIAVCKGWPPKPFSLMGLGSRPLTSWDFELVDGERK